MLGIFRNPMAYILTGSLTFVLAACYGGPVEYRNTKVVRVKTTENTPIEGIKVTFKKDDSITKVMYTNEFGAVETGNNSIDPNKVIIEDVDGEKNYGTFKIQELPITQEELYEITLVK